jgi:4-amino-4-deoxy-L-arabinose transferase-like glycosyltransferase
MRSSETYHRLSPVWSGRALVLALLLLGAALRLGGTGSVPPGLYHDEAQNGLDALRVLQGELPLYFAANNGREPGFIYLIAAAVALLGRTPLAIRLPSFFIGTLTLAATYDLARTLFAVPGQSRAAARRMGRLALATLAVTLWHVHLSRVGFRAVLLPLFTALYLGQAVRALRSRRARHWIAAGALYGASWYTYIAARFTPVAIAALIGYGLYDHWRRRRTVPQAPVASGLGRGAALAIATALVILLPLGIHTPLHPDVVLARSGQVSILSDAIHQGRFWHTLGQHSLRTAGMFTLRGDRIWRHNLAWRPVWDPALGLAFTVGLGVCLAGILGSRPELVLIAVWTAVMALPTLLAEDAPHFLRAAGVLPTAALIPAVGLAWLSSAVHRVTGRRTWATLVPWLLLGFGLVSTTYDYFIRYPAAPSTYTWFEGGAVDLAGQLNALRGAGWDGTRIQHLPVRHNADASAPPITLYVDRLVWEEWAALPFLLAEDPAQMPVRFLPDSVGETPSSAIYAVWPYREWEADILPYLPHPSYLRVLQGPHAQGDRDLAPFTTALIIAATQRPPVPEPVGYFEGGIQLRAALVRAGEGMSELRLWWETSEPLDEDYTVFIHYMRNGDRIAQHDGQPGLGHLRTSFWQPGDLILDISPLNGVAPLPAYDSLRVGLYEATTGRTLSVVDATGHALNTVDPTALDLPVILVTD